MSNIDRRLDKIEKQLLIEEPHIGIIAGMEIASDELDELLKKIAGERSVLPSEAEVLECKNYLRQGNE